MTRPPQRILRISTPSPYRPSLRALVAGGVIAAAAIAVALLWRGAENAHQVADLQIRRLAALERDVRAAAIVAQELALVERRQEAEVVADRALALVVTLRQATSGLPGSAPSGEVVRVGADLARSVDGLLGDLNDLAVDGGERSLRATRAAAIVDAVRGPVTENALRLVVAIEERRAERVGLYTTIGYVLTTVLAGLALGSMARRRRSERPARETSAVSGRHAPADILGQLAAGAALFDAQDRLIYANEAFRDVFEVGDDPIPAGTPYEMVFRGAAVKGRIAGVRRDETDWLARRMERHRDEGTVRDKLSTSTGRSFETMETRLANGGTFVLHIDVTDYERREAARQTAEQKALAMLDTVFDGVMTFDVDGTIDTVNKRTADIFSYQVEDLRGRPLRTIMPHLDLKQALNGDLSNGTLSEIVGRRRDGNEFPLEISGNEIKDTWSLADRRRAQRRTFMFTLRDVTRQKQLARQVEQAQRMDAIGTLAGGIAHDFNNILSIIMGYGGLLQQELPDGSEGREHADMVVQAARRGRGLVDQILTFSRRTDLQKKPLDPAPVVKEALKLMRSTLPVTLRIEQSIDSRGRTVVADPSQLHQVLVNLCTNAAQAIGDRPGEVRVGLDVRPLSASDAERLGVPAGDYFRLTVADDGAGIDSAIRERVFEPFFTTKERGRGTGLGLSVVHGIVSDLGGSIALTSAVGKGTTFEILLPADRAPAVPEVATEPGRAPLGKARVLFVDDEEPIVRMGQKVLARLGYTVVGATISEEALAAFRATPQSFDLVITDQTMPGLTGDALVREIRRLRPDIPIILCTGYSQSVGVDEAKRLGIDRFLMKPLEASELGQAVGEALAAEDRSG